jgi:hypothetical protein
MVIPDVSPGKDNTGRLVIDVVAFIARIRLASGLHSCAQASVSEVDQLCEF